MSQEGTTHVQTELDRSTYETFRTLARERGLTVKEAGHEALLEWVDRQRRADPNDRAFTVLDELDTAAAAETDARREDDLVDDWTGDGVGLRLAEEPATED